MCAGAVVRTHEGHVQHVEGGKMEYEVFVKGGQHAPSVLLAEEKVRSQSEVCTAMTLICEWICLRVLWEESDLGMHCKISFRFLVCRAQ